jgi:3'-5' exoribonuclease
MKNKAFICDLVDGDLVRSVFLVTDKRLGTTRNGDPFLTVELSDKTGSVVGRVWDEAEAIASRFEQDDFVAVDGQIETYKGKLQLNVRDLKRVAADQIELSDFVPASRWDRQALLEQLKDLVSRELESPEMLRFFDTLFSRDELMDRFATAPAAKGNHHAYVGGLVEHTLSMARVGARLTDHYAHYYPGLLNQDLVIAGCVLHDIGKCFELSYGRSFGYTDEGQLVGHIVQGVELVTEIAAQISPPLPASLLMQLKHLIASHHGKREYGSPVRPQTPEAMLLHQIDMIDSRMAMCADIFEEHGQGQAPAEAWTGYQRLFQTSLYAGAQPASPWAKVRQPKDDTLEGPGASPAGDSHNADAAADTAQRRGAEVGESELNLDLFSK